MAAGFYIYIICIRGVEETQIEVELETWTNIDSNCNVPGNNNTAFFRGVISVTLLLVPCILFEICPGGSNFFSLMIQILVMVVSLGTFGQCSSK